MIMVCNSVFLLFLLRTAQHRFGKKVRNMQKYSDTIYLRSLSITGDDCNNLKATTEQCPIVGSVLHRD